MSTNIITCMKDKFNMLRKSYMKSKSESESENYMDLLPDDITEVIYQLKDKMETTDIDDAEHNFFMAYSHLETVGYRDFSYIDNCNDYTEEQAEIVDAIEAHLGISIDNIESLKNQGENDPVLMGFLEDFDYRFQEWLANEHRWEAASQEARLAERECVNALSKYKTTVLSLGRKQTGYIAFCKVHFSMVRRKVNKELADNKEMYQNLDHRQCLRSPFVSPSTIMVINLINMWDRLSCEDRDAWDNTGRPR